MQDKPIAWMVARGGIPVSLTFYAGRWCVLRPQQETPPRIDYAPDGNERLQPLDEFLAEAERAIELRPKTRVA